MGKWIFNFRVDEDFLIMTQNTDAIKEKIKFDHIKIENSCCTKYQK